jgi:hypothetical protein
MSQHRSHRRVLATCAVTVAVSAASAAASAGPASAEPLPCSPVVTGYGPTITVDVDYNDPSRSSVSYDSSDFSVQVDPCA